MSDEKTPANYGLDPVLPIERRMITGARRMRLNPGAALDGDPELVDLGPLRGLSVEPRDGAVVLVLDGEPAELPPLQVRAIYGQACDLAQGALYAARGANKGPLPRPEPIGEELTGEAEDAGAISSFAYFAGREDAIDDGGVVVAYLRTCPEYVIRCELTPGQAIAWCKAIKAAFSQLSPAESLVDWTLSKTEAEVLLAREQVRAQRLITP